MNSEEQDRSIKYKVIAETQDTGDPVIRATLGESKVEFIAIAEECCINVAHVESKVRGDFKKLMDDIVSQFSFNWVQILTPLDDEDKKLGNEIYEQLSIDDEQMYPDDDSSRNIRDAVDGFQEVTEVISGQEVEMLVGNWEA